MIALGLPCLVPKMAFVVADAQRSSMVICFLPPYFTCALLYYLSVSSTRQNARLSCHWYNLCSADHTFGSMLRPSTPDEFARQKRFLESHPTSQAELEAFVAENSNCCYTGDPLGLADADSLPEEGSLDSIDICRLDHSEPNVLRNCAGVLKWMFACVILVSPLLSCCVCYPCYFHVLQRAFGDLTLPQSRALVIASFSSTPESVTAAQSDSFVDQFLDSMRLSGLRGEKQNTPSQLRQLLADASSHFLFTVCSRDFRLHYLPISPFSLYRLCFCLVHFQSEFGMYGRPSVTSNLGRFHNLTIGQVRLRCLTLILFFASFDPYLYPRPVFLDTIPHNISVTMQRFINVAVRCLSPEDCITPGPQALLQFGICSFIVVAFLIVFICSVFPFFLQVNLARLIRMSFHLFFEIKLQLKLKLNDSDKLLKRSMMITSSNLRLYSMTRATGFVSLQFLWLCITHFLSFLSLVLFCSLRFLNMNYITCCCFFLSLGYVHELRLLFTCSVNRLAFLFLTGGVNNVYNQKRESSRTALIQGANIRVSLSSLLLPSPFLFSLSFLSFVSLLFFVSWVLAWMTILILCSLCFLSFLSLVSQMPSRLRELGNLVSSFRYVLLFSNYFHQMTPSFLPLHSLPLPLLIFHWLIFIFFLLSIIAFHFLLPSLPSVFS